MKAVGSSEFVAGDAEYDEQLQEELYCKGASSEAAVSFPTLQPRAQGQVVENLQYPPVKRTFIHYDSPSSLARQLTLTVLRRCSSAPSMMMTGPFCLVRPSMEILHLRGECDPCAFYKQKEDGCRWGSACKFCHLCPPGEMKNRKKEKRRARRMQSWTLASARLSHNQLELLAEKDVRQSTQTGAPLKGLELESPEARVKDSQEEEEAQARERILEVARGAPSSRSAAAATNSSSSAAAAVPVTAAARNVHYKTAICKYYSWNRCKNGSSCSFSHGVKELRSPPRQRQVATKAAWLHETQG